MVFTICIFNIGDAGYKFKPYLMKPFRKPNNPHERRKSTQVREMWLSVARQHQPTFSSINLLLDCCSSLQLRSDWLGPHFLRYSLHILDHWAQLRTKIMSCLLFASVPSNDCVCREFTFSHKLLHPKFYNRFSS